MKKIVRQMSLYHQYHTQPLTQTLHAIGVPCLIFAALIFLGWIHIAVPNLFQFNLAWITVLAVLVYYFFLDIPLAAIMTVILIILAMLADFFSQPAISKLGVITFFIFFIIGIIAQILGHIFEGKRPAFLDNFSQVLIAPLYLVAQILFKLGYRKKLEMQILQTAGQGEMG